MAKILFVEDDKGMATAITKWLTNERHVVEVVANGNDAIQNLLGYKYDLVILDWQLPGMSGLDVCKEYRASAGTAMILMLTGKKDLADIERGLDAGADDYLTKPFHPRELSARLRTMLRRTSIASSNGELRAGGLTLLPGSYKACLDGEEIDLSPQEFLILEFLIRNANRPVSNKELLRCICEKDETHTSETIRTRIKLLRKKLDKSGEPSWILNIHGRGYQFCPLD